MGRKLHGIRGEQWDICQRCGQWWPMSDLVKQNSMGRILLICTVHCWDDPEIEQRERMIAEVLGQGVEQEGADTRGVDWAFFPSREDG